MACERSSSYTSIVVGTAQTARRENALPRIISNVCATDGFPCAIATHDPGRECYASLLHKFKRWIQAEVQVHKVHRARATTSLFEGRDSGFLPRIDQLEAVRWLSKSMGNPHHTEAASYPVWLFGGLTSGSDDQKTGQRIPLGLRLEYFDRSASSSHYASIVQHHEQFERYCEKGAPQPQAWNQCLIGRWSISRTAHTCHLERLQSATQIRLPFTSHLA